MAVLCLHPGSELRSHLRLDRRMVGYGFVRGCCPGVSPSRWLQVTRVPWLHDWGSLCACAASLQAVLKGVPSSPLALLWVPISTAYLGCFRRPPAATTAAIAQTLGHDGRVGIALCWASQLIAGASAASHGGAVPASEPTGLGEEMGMLSPVQPARLPADRHN